MLEEKYFRKGKTILNILVSLGICEKEY